MKTIQIEITKNGENKGDERIKVGTISTVCPTLDDFGITAATTKDKEGKESFVNPAHVWLASVIETATANQIKSYLVPQTATFKDGYSAPATLENIYTPPESGLRGAALALRRAFITAFSAFFVGLKKSEKLTTAMCAMAGLDETKFSTTSPKHKELFSKYLGEFFAFCSDEDKTRFEKFFVNLAKLCQADGELEDE